MAIQPVPGGAVVTTDAPHDLHYVDWCPIIAGAFLATAISVVLFTFGTGIGLSMVSPYEGEGTSKTAWFMALGLWSLWVVVSSFMAGGYLAGRLRRRVGDGSEHEVEVRDGAHGLSVWAVGIVAGALLLALGVTGLAGGALKVAAPAAAVATAKADPTDFTLDALFRAPATAPATPAAQPVATNDPMMTAPAMAPPAPAPAAAPAPRSLDADRAEVGRLLTMGMVKGELSADNKTYVARVVSAQTGMSQAESERRVNEVLAETKRKADQARKLGILLAFFTAVALLVAGAAAAWAATLGGRHRDQGTNTSAFWRWA